MDLLLPEVPDHFRLLAQQLHRQGENQQGRDITQYLGYHHQDEFGQPLCWPK